MDFDVPFQIECTISGPLCFVLYLSRIFGLAPLKFENVRRGWSIRVSRIYSLYGQTLIIILVFSAMAALVADVTVNKENSLRTNTNANLFLWTADLLLVNMVIYTGAYTGVNRMRNTINCMVQLKQINKELSRYHQSSSQSESKIWLLAIIFILIGCFANALEHVIFMFEVVNVNGNVLTSNLYLAHNILCFVVIIFVVQFWLISKSVLPSLQALNYCLRKIHEDTLLQVKPDLIYKRSQINMCNQKSYKTPTCVQDSRPVKEIGDMDADVNTNSATLHQLTLLYCSLCDIVRQLNSCNGFILVLLFLTLVLHLIITLYHLVIGFFADIEYSDHSNTPLQLALVIYQMMKLVLVIEPCHRTHEQMKLTRILVNQMRRYTLPENFAVASKLKMFYRHIMLNHVTYSPMQLFVINRTLIVAIMGSITTYLIVVIQL